MRKTMFGLAVVLGLSGCGAMSTLQEDRHYEEERAARVVQARKACATSGLNHATTDKELDCYDVTVDMPPRRLAGDAAVPPWPKPPELAQGSAREVVADLAWMAVLARTAYSRHMPLAQRGDGVGCDRERAGRDNHPVERLGAGAAGRWRLWRDEGREPGCVAEKGMFMEVLVYQPVGESRFTHAVLAFRGTEPSGDSFRVDMRANVSMALNLEPREFEVLRSRLPGIIQALKDKGAPNLQIYATGHSLGGSLAQLAAYLSADVRQAYAFNTSPVTGWTWLRKLDPATGVTIANEDPRIVRVSQRGDGLGLLRSIASRYNAKRFGRADVEFDFYIGYGGSGNGKFESLSATDFAVDRHSMELLTCNLLARVKGPARFDLQQQQAQQLLDQFDDKGGWVLADPDRNAKDPAEPVCGKPVVDFLRRQAVPPT